MLSWIGLGKPTTVSVSLWEMKMWFHSSYMWPTNDTESVSKTLKSTTQNLLSKCVSNKFTSARFQEIFNVLFSVKCQTHKSLVKINMCEFTVFPSPAERYLTLGAHGSPLGKDTLSAGRWGMGRGITSSLSSGKVSASIELSLSSLSSSSSRESSGL